MMLDELKMLFLSFSVIYALPMDVTLSKINNLDVGLNIVSTI